MKNNLYNNRDEEYKKDELLAIIASNLELDENRKQKMESAYRAVNDVLSRDEDFFKNYKIQVYAQGSLIIGTTVRPLPGKEFDLDIVLHIEDSYLNHSPTEIYNELFRVLSSHDTYKPLLQKKNRCVRINYNSDFHMDILPGCIITTDNTRLMIAENSLRLTWSRTNPKGYAEWFKRISEINQSQFLLTERYNMMIKASVETEDLPTDIFLKTPLQRTVQIIKRYRDLYYNTKNLNTNPAVSSVVLTTLLAKSSAGELSIQAALKNAVIKFRKLADDYKLNGIKFKLHNPVDTHEDPDKRENFTDSWEDKHYDSFADFVYDLERKVTDFLTDRTNEDNYKNLFGNGFYKENIQSLVKLEEKISGNNRMTALLSGTALTDSFGNINIQTGTKNGSHGFYAE